jgi:ribose/xylose/arabinose/galactoside ABC-type transport system permease subunit
MKISARTLYRDPHARPLAILLACIVLLELAGMAQGRLLGLSTVFGAFQTFATLGPVALALGLTMLIGEFDLSVGGMFGVAACIAVLTGGEYPWLGIAAALATGIALGTIQGLIIVQLRLGSVGVTLGGLLISIGGAYVLTENRALNYPNMDVALALSNPIAGVFSIRSVVAFAIVGAAAAILGLTRIGRDMIATGSDRRAAMTVGVKVDTLIVATFAFSGAMAALSGTLLSYSLTSASPSGLGDVLVPAATAAILGGVSLRGGAGRPLGIATGVLTLAALRSGFNAIGAPPYVNDIAMGAILIAVAIMDGPYLAQRFLPAVRWLRRTPL